jgi:hypothetical protein
MTVLHKLSGSYFNSNELREGTCKQHAEHKRPSFIAADIFFGMTRISLPAEYERKILIHTW